MARNGPRFLERTRDEFLEDLRDSFGDRSEAFTEDLRVLLFEMWVRARSRPPFPVNRPEPSDTMKQVELEARLSTALSSIVASQNPELAAEFVRCVQRSITTGAGITRFDRAEALNITLDPFHHAELEQEPFAKMLDQVLKLEGTGLEKFHDMGLHQVELELKSDARAQIPEIEEHEATDDDQPRLAKRLEKLGVLPPGNWLPVFQHTETGARAGIDVPALERHVLEEVDSLLVCDGINWLFPNPKPVHDYATQEHIRFFVDGIEDMAAGATWIDSYDSTRACQVLDSVWLPLATPTSRVRAIYSVVQKEYGTS